MREIDEGNGWKIREILDPSSRKRHTQYFFQRKRAPRIQLVDKVSRQLAGYTLIEKDLRNVLAWLEEISRLVPPEGRSGKSVLSGDRAIFNLVKGLYVASLTFYGKCFTKCEGRGIKLEQRIIDEPFLEAHRGVMHMRHNFAAHSGADNFEEVKIALVLHPNKQSLDPPRLFRELMQPDLAEESGEEKRFVELVEHVRSKVLQKASALEKRIFEKEVMPKGKLYWYRRAKK